MEDLAERKWINSTYDSPDKWLESSGLTPFHSGMGWNRLPEEVRNALSKHVPKLPILPDEVQS